MSRVVRPGGVVAVSTWGAEDERWSWEEDELSTLASGVIEQQDEATLDRLRRTASERMQSA